MKKVATHKGYDYYIGKDETGIFYNIVPSGQLAPNGGYAKEIILGIKKAADMFPYSPEAFFNTSNRVQLTKDETKQLKKVKKELLTDHNATPSSQSRNYEILEEIAKKYKVDTQVIYDSID